MGRRLCNGIAFRMHHANAMIIFHEMTYVITVGRPNDRAVVPRSNNCAGRGYDYGTNLATTLEAARYARSSSGKEAITLVIGQEEGDGAVCEGFAFDQIRAAIHQIRPVHVVWVGIFPIPGSLEYTMLEPLISAYAATLKEAYITALRMTDPGSMVLAVKTWR